MTLAESALAMQQSVLSISAFLEKQQIELLKKKPKWYHFYSLRQWKTKVSEFRNLRQGFYFTFLNLTLTGCGDEGLQWYISMASYEIHDIYERVEDIVSYNNDHDYQKTIAIMAEGFKGWSISKT